MGPGASWASGLSRKGTAGAPKGPGFKVPHENKLLIPLMQGLSGGLPGEAEGPRTSGGRGGSWLSGPAQGVDAQGPRWQSRSLTERLVAEG